MSRQASEEPLTLRLSSAVSIALAIGFVLTTLFGAVRAWHPAPLGDVWDGFLRSWYRLPEVGVSEWWAQHNEHRVVMGRSLAWLDLLLTGGAGWPLLVLSLAILAGTTALIIWLMRRHVVNVRGDTLPRAGLLVVTGVLIATCWSWLSSENLLWTFQVPFFAVVALSLGAFALVAAASQLPASRRRTAFLVLAGVLALVAPWSIPAGLATPFVTAALATMLHVRRVYAYVLVFGGLLSTAAYAIGFVSPGLAGPEPSPFDDPVGALRFVLAYLGGPFAVVTGSTAFGIIAGAVLLGLSAWWSVRAARMRSLPPYGAALLGFIAFTVIEAVMVVMGRADRGIDAATVLRYQSLLVVAWACVIALWAPSLMDLLSRRPLTGAATALAVPVLLALWQPWSLADPSGLNAARDRALLAAAIGAHDTEVLQPLYPDAGILDDVVPRLQADGFTVLGREPYVNLRSGIGRAEERVTVVDPGCRFAIDATEPMPSDGLTRVTMNGGSGGRITGLARLIDSAAVTVGYADVQPLSVLGYMSDDAAPPVTLVADGVHCAITG